MIIQAIRSLIFYALFLTFTALTALLLGLASLIFRRWFPSGAAVVLFWSRTNLFLLRYVVGIRTRVDGAENIPDGACIIASKHQSDWDIFAILPHTGGRPAFIAKRELMDIPFFGRAARTLETITIDRKRGSEAIPGMLADAKGAISRGCRIVIFPEGTRSPPLTPGRYKLGTMHLYEGLGVPLVPVAVNSGLFWPRNGLVLWPGVARARFLPPIPPGLPGAQMQQMMVGQIEAASDQLVLEAAQEGIARPLNPEMRVRLDGLKRAAAGGVAGSATTY